MGKFDYNELYMLLYNMKSAKSMGELADNIYCSISKVSKMIKTYEQHLKVQLFVRGKENILSEDGHKLLLEIEGPLKQLNKIAKIEHNVIGVDENLIEDINACRLEYDITYNNATDLIEQYNCGNLDKIVVSSDFETEFEYETKKFILEKSIYKIRHFDYEGNKLYANRNGCPISLRLQKHGLLIDEYLNQSVAICKVVRQCRGIAYTFSIETLNPEYIEIQKIDDLTINFFLYTKY